MSMCQFRDVLSHIFVAVLPCDFGDAHIEDVLGTNWDGGKVGIVVVDDVWENDEGVCDDLAASIAGSWKRRRMII